MMRSFIFLLISLCFLGFTRHEPSPNCIKEDFGSTFFTDCSQRFSESSFENVFSANSNALSGRAFAAFDLTVEAGMDFALDKISINVAVDTEAASVTSVELKYYNNSATNQPGIEIGTQTLVPTSETTLGENFGFVFRRIVMDITPFTFRGDETTDTTYWITLQLTAENPDFASSNAGIETTITDMPNGFHTYVSNSGAWVYPIDAETGEDVLAEPVYELEGRCETLSTKDFLKAEDYFTIYPNPTTEKIKIQTKKQIKIRNISVLNTSGKVVFTESSETEITVNHLATGVYFLEIETNQGTFVEKFIKK